MLGKESSSVIAAPFQIKAPKPVRVVNGP